ncbi:YbaK/EbsC family protein [Roseomonas gilardii]|nr:hypothetical protein [Roseomonas gilardii]SUE44678.1 Uncharacterized conserved protein [Roseomonas gilardii subsp. rosea]
MPSLPTAIEEAALAEPHVFVNGGQRGLQLRLAPVEARAALEALSLRLVA